MREKSAIRCQSKFQVQLYISDEKRHGMNTKQLANWVKLLLIVLSTAAVCLAQSDTARLQGTVTDPSGAAINGGIVNVTSTETGRLTSVTTNELGYYSATALPPGNYKVEISQKGFKKVSRTLELQVAQLGVADFQLTVGEATETVIVEAGSPVINAQDSALGEVVEADGGVVSGAIGAGCNPWKWRSNGLEQQCGDIPVRARRGCVAGGEWLAAAGRQFYFGRNRQQ